MVFEPTVGADGKNEGVETTDPLIAFGKSVTAGKASFAVGSR